MNLEEKIRLYFKEAEVYRSQSLLDEALDKYRMVEKLIQENRKIQNKKPLLERVAARIAEMEKRCKKENKPAKPPPVSDEAQSLMKEMFSFDDPQTKGSASLGGAIALAQFGQYDKAIEEFNRLLECSELRFEAAKHLLQCWISQRYSDYAISLFQKWKKTKFLPLDQLEALRNQLQGMLKKEGIERDLSDIEVKKTVEPDSEVEDEDILDINSIRFDLPQGPDKGRRVELEVGFQSGKFIKMIIPREEKSLIQSIKPGDLLKQIVFYSPVAIFSGTGFVSSKKEISSGPKRGDYSLEIKIISISS